MFEDSLVESSGRLRQRDPWSTAFSFTVQVAFVGLLVLLPLIYTEGLPKQQLLSLVEAPSPPPALAQHTPPPPGRPIKPIHQSRNEILTPRAIPKVIAIAHDEPTGPPELRGVVGEVPDGIPGGVPAALMNLIPGTVAPVPKEAMPSKIRVSSGVAEGMLIYRVQPQYPTLARQARIQGTVVLQAVIGKDGAVRGLRVITGHPMLTQAAIEAVSGGVTSPVPSTASRLRWTHGST